MYIFAVFLASGVLVSALPQAPDTPNSSCEVEVSACQQRFTTGVREAGTDVQSKCIAAQTLSNCLSQREGLPRCKSSQNQIDLIKQTYANQITSSDCGNPDVKACVQGLINCRDAYNNPPANNGNDTCQKVNTYITCLNGITCQGKVILKIAEELGSIRKMVKASGSPCTLVASAFAAATDCNTDVVNCEQTFKAAANASGNDVTASCNAANAFLACLDTKDNSPDCTSVKSVISNLRSSYASQISALGCNSNAPGSGPLKCSKDIQACQQQFVVDDTKAGDDNTAACRAGEALGNCLTGIQGKPECGGAKKVIDSLRSTYHSQINTQGCAAIIRPEQTQCQKDVVACEQTFTAAVKASATNAVAQCNAGVVFMACLDQYDHKVECLAAQSAISSMRAIFSAQITGLGCGSGVKPTVTACQGEVLGCEKAFTDALKIAGNNVDKQCSAGATLTKCLDDKDKAPECASVKDTIANLRNSYASQIKTAGCAGNADPNNAGVKCTLDITNCEETLQTQIKDAGTDVKSQCLAGSTMEACLTQVENNPACTSTKASVDALKSSYQQQIDQTACALVASAFAAATDCNTDVVNCEQTFKAAANASGNDVTASCNAANAFLACLDTKDNSPDCTSVKSVISNLRSSYASQISALGCNSNAPGSGPLKCSKDIQACQQQFVVDDTKAGDDNTAACRAGEALGNCLTGIQGKPECGGAKKVIDSLRSTYHSQINTQGCAAIIRPEQTQCQKDVVACEQTFTAAVKASATNAVAQCNAGVVFMACLDQYDHKVECLAAQSAISSMRAIFSAQITGLGCGSGAKPTVTACQGEVLGCEKAFTDALKIAGNNVDKQCSAGATLTKCLDDKDKAPECASVKDTIANLRNSYASQIKTAGCAGNADPNNAGVKCTLDITNCEETLQTQIKDAGTDVKSQCLAGSTMEACLTQVENNPACTSTKASVDALKSSYQQQIDQTACVSKAATDCAEGVLTCSNTFHTNYVAATNDDGRCKTSNTYIKCLNKVKCSKSFESQLTTAVLMVKQMLADNSTTPCQLVKFIGSDSGNGAASSLTTSTGTFLMGLLMVFYAMLLQ